MTMARRRVFAALAGTGLVALGFVARPIVMPNSAGTAKGPGSSAAGSSSTIRELAADPPTSTATTVLQPITTVATSFRPPATTSVTTTGPVSVVATTQVPANSEAPVPRRVPPFIVTPNLEGSEHFIAVLGDWPSGEPTAPGDVDNLVTQLAPVGFQLASVRSDLVSSLVGGRDVVYLGPFSTIAGASLQCEGVEPIVPDCYPRTFAVGPDFFGEDWWLGPFGSFGEGYLPSIDEYTEAGDKVVPVQRLGGAAETANPSEGSTTTEKYAGNGQGPTLCNDGTISNSAGQGTCSHHGGIADWHPYAARRRARSVVSTRPPSAPCPNGHAG